MNVLSTCNASFSKNNVESSDFDVDSPEISSENVLLETNSDDLKDVLLNQQLKIKNKTKISASINAYISTKPENIIEYEWPRKTGNFYFIQEQISQLLDVKSFKRKYPDLIRRTIEPDEREYLINYKELNKVLSPYLLNHLTALRSLEIHDLMSTEYPLIYADYQKTIAERQKQELIIKQKELDMIKLDTKKMDELRKKAMKSANKFNKELQMLKKVDRKFFYDIQTSIIQSSANLWFRLRKEDTRPSPYSVALIPGQFMSHFKWFNEKDLKRLPFNTILENDDLFIPKRERSPSPVRVKDEHLIKDIAESNAEIDINQISGLKDEADDKIIDISNKQSRRSSTTSNGKRGRKSLLLNSNKMFHTENTSFSIGEIEEEDRRCIVCNLQEHEIPLQGLVADLQKPTLTPFVKCSECLHEMHAGCIDMPVTMVNVVKKYQWRCAECKECTVCSKPDQEDAMMCCDLCDRGYHTFCIGLVNPPIGPFVCIRCK